MSPDESLYKVKTKGIDAINSDSDDDHDLATRVSLARSKSVDQLRSKSVDQLRSKSVDQFRPKSVYQYRRRAEKVRSVSTREKKEDEPQKVVPESKPEPEEEKVGDIVRFGRNSYFVVDIFEKEIMELGDQVDLNFKRFNKFKAVDGCSPWDHHFNYYRCCYSSCCCVCGSSNVEREWEILQRELEKRDGSNGVSFFVRTYNERKELMRVAVTDQSHSVFFFDVKFPIEYPHQAPSLFYHPYGLPLSNFETQLKPKFCYNMLDVFLHIEEIVMRNTNKSCHQMLDMLKRPLNGFEDFVKGHFRKKGAFILQNMMEEMDLAKERDRNRFFKMYVAFEDNKTYCEHLLNSALREELERFKEKERSLSDHYYSSPSSYFQPITSRFDDIQKTSRYKNFLSKIFLF